MTETYPTCSECGEGEGWCECPATPRTADYLSGLRAAGFASSVVGTGGGCTAIETAPRRGWSVLITAADDAGYPDPQAPDAYAATDWRASGVHVGLYDNDEWSDPLRERVVSPTVGAVVDAVTDLLTNAPRTIRQETGI